MHVTCVSRVRSLVKLNRSPGTHMSLLRLAAQKVRNNALVISIDKCRGHGITLHGGIVRSAEHYKSSAAVQYDIMSIADKR